MVSCVLVSTFSTAAYPQDMAHLGVSGMDEHPDRLEEKQ